MSLGGRAEVYALESDPSMQPQRDPRVVERVRQRLTRVVRVRFSLDLHTLAERVVDVAGRQSAEPPAAFADRLVLDDLYLATACAGGEDRAWEEFGARYFAFIRTFSRRTLREPQASDVADQVIADLWQRKKVAQYEGRSSLKTWLGAVVAHAAINAAKQARTTEPVRGETTDLERRAAATVPHDAMVGRDAGDRMARWVSDAIQQLAPDERCLLLLYYEQGLTLDEISPIAKRSKAALSRRLDRIRQDLRARVDRLAREATGGSAEDARADLDLGRIEFDLSALASQTERGRRNVV
jgi:RNA polymerase sigma-70 factor